MPHMHHKFCMCMLLPPPQPSTAVHAYGPQIRPYRVYWSSGVRGGSRGGKGGPCPPPPPPPFETEPARNAEVCHALSVTQRTSLYESHLHVLQYIQRSNLQLPSLRDSSLAVPQTQGLIRKGKASEKRQYHESPGFTLL